MIRSAAFLAAAAALAAAARCGSSAEPQPIVIDLTQKNPTPAPTATVARPPEPSRTAAPPPAARTAAPPAAEPTSAAGWTAPAPASEVDTPERVVEGQLAARNRADLEALLSFFAPDAKVFEGERLTVSGREELRRHFAAHLARSPGLSARVTSRMIQGSYVVEQEEFEGGRHGAERAMVVYEVGGGRIVRVWILH